MEFQNICNEMVAPFLLRHPVYTQVGELQFFSKIVLLQAFFPT